MPLRLGRAATSLTGGTAERTPRLPNVDNRRPLETRSRGWARSLARALTAAGVTPNAISVASVLFAAIGAALLVFSPRSVGLVAAAACVQLRLLCNMLDGMVAIEGGRQTATGVLYNELPDRIADSLLIVALGVASGAAWLGWLGALAAAVTAYIRALGGTLGLAQDFGGPLAKPQRMFVMTVGCLGAAVEVAIVGSRYSMLTAAWIVAVGSILTCVLRARRIAALLRGRAGA
jgi:phosphatidylglycerophosphate synthase